MRTSRCRRLASGIEDIAGNSDGAGRTGLLVFSASLKGLNLVVNEKARGNLPPAGYNFEDGVEGDAGERGNSDGAHDGCTMCAGHAVYGHVVSLLNVELHFV